MKRVTVSVDGSQVFEMQRLGMPGEWFGVRASVGVVMLRNLQVDGQTSAMQGLPFGEFGPIQLNTRGVEFGPWVRRFVFRVKEHMPAPDARAPGHVTVTFQVHRDGSITDVAIASPSPIDDWNRAARDAVVESNPLQPLPSEYPEDHASLTVTFYFNESPPR